MNAQIEPLVSIVTPFYNTEDYLAECIESVLSQTYKNWEYILVNNCSTDRSAEIANRYASKNERVTVVHNEIFLSQVQNYNHALSLISQESTYCKMVQADDFILPECISRMVAVAEKDPSVGIVSAYRLCGTSVRNVGLNYRESIFDGREVCRKIIIYGGHYIGSPTSILIRSDIVRSQNPFYREDSYFEDTLACFEILKSWNFGFVHQVESFTREDNDSITSKITKYDPDYLLLFFTIIHVYGKYCLDVKELKENYKKIENKYLKYLSRNLINRRSEEFWDYHKNALNLIGYKINKYKIYKIIILELVYSILSPLKDIKKIILGKY